ncbi:Microcystin dependent protein [Labilithrix luteola]|uniref:Microcystin dependent protein n=1 Tax=Labilithrix luteola TaxID=1391654 RepID=A0A0K1QDX0_9BACT|nr:tail fiber protein [Labilithrix luteola]AKV03630.1 Microcystin dependent protein [Labilithrix luteola]
MSTPYVGEIRMFAGNFAPAGWMLCQGQILQISQYAVLYNLIGVTYGGDGVNTFALPDLRGRVPIHMGTNAGVTYPLGQQAGVESVTLTTSQLPTHTHAWNVVGTAGSADTAKLPNGYLANGSALSYDNNAASARTALGTSTIAPTGGNQPHENMAPFLCINFIIALFGVFPSQT